LLYVYYYNMSAAESRITGRVKWFNNKAGYGFISVNENTDVFVHHSAIKTSTDQFRYLVEGEYCEFKMVEVDKEKVTATDVTGPNRDKLMCETRNERRQLHSSSPTDNENDEKLGIKFSEGKGKGKGKGNGKDNGKGKGKGKERVKRYL